MLNVKVMVPRRTTDGTLVSAAYERTMEHYIIQLFGRFTRLLEAPVGWTDEHRGDLPDLGLLQQHRAPHREVGVMDYELIDSYSREDAIKDGVLRDVTSAARTVGIHKLLVAITQEAWDLVIDHQDEQAALLVLMREVRAAMGRASGEAETLLDLPGAPASEEGPRRVRITLHREDCGPCLTILLPGQD